ncbi:MAG TPA: hypothetical protein VHA37_01690, partial [Candidatus Saccharimonadales bacterium]|nr:hypothetical protein [Candidatus Saccharimonadales bacterium]
DLRRLTDMETEAVRLLNQAASRIGLSARAYLRTLAVARTIADLDAAAAVGTTHLAESLSYRSDSQAAKATGKV